MDFLDQIPEWLKWIGGIVGGGGAGGMGMHQWWKMKLQSDSQEFEQNTSFREELRGEISTLRKRQDKYERELVEARNKYFEMQESYLKLKIKYEEARQENEKMREEIKSLREEIKTLRDKLNK